MILAPRQARRFRRMRSALALLALMALAAPATSQTTATPAAPAAPATPATPPAAPAPDAPPAVPAPAAPAGAGTEAPAANAPAPDSSTGQAMELPARPVAMIHGSAKWDDGFGAITAAFAKINGEVAKAGLASSGRPMTVFTETDDEGFRYDAMVPLVSAPDGKDALSADVKLGKSPPGKALKFQHRAAYTEIDTTYEAITAYLDEKGLEAQNLFIEEYLNDPKDADDDSLQVDIYVLVK